MTGLTVSEVMKIVNRYIGVSGGYLDDGMTRLFKLIRQQHPSFQNLGARSQDIERILQSFANIMDALNPIRNTASVAHPNADLLKKDEAMLVVNSARTLLHYLNAKLS